MKAYAAQPLRDIAVLPVLCCNLSLACCWLAMEVFMSCRLRWVLVDRKSAIETASGFCLSLAACHFSAVPGYRRVPLCLF
jgi:hypothetical protein